MDTERLAGTRAGKWFIRVLAAGMESQFRYRFFSPTSVLTGAGIAPGQIVLEVGCGTGFFTLPAARLIGETGSMTSIDVVPESVAMVSEKVQNAGLKNLRILQADARATALPSGTFDAVLLLGVVPAPMLPLASLLPELHRLLKVGGTLSVWPPVPGWLPRSIVRSGWFTLSNKHGGVHNFLRC